MITRYTPLRCPEDLLAKAELRADAGRLSLSEYIAGLIEKDAGEVVLPASALKARKARKRGRPRKLGRPKKRRSERATS